MKRLQFPISVSMFSFAAILAPVALIHAAELHVAITGSDASPGTQAAPLRTIQRAAEKAIPGDTVTVHAGLYREHVNPPRGGISDSKRIVYRAAPGEKAVIAGSEIIKQWQKVQEDVWKAVLPNSLFGGFSPYNDIIGGEWYGTPADGFDRHPPGRNYITVRGFTMRQAGTPWAGAMSEQIGLIGTHWSKGWIIEENEISHSMNTGITLGRYDLGRYGIAMPPATAPGFVKTCELASQHGWSKDNIGSHVVRSNRISHCEKNGIHGSLGGIFSAIEGNIIHDIAVKGWIGGSDGAELTLLGSVDTLIKNNHIFLCGGSGGIWLDWMAQWPRVTGNLLHDNAWDLFMEVDHGPWLIDHNLLLSRNSVRDRSQGGAYAHNLIQGNIEARADLSRETPYFAPHTVADVRLSSFKKTDRRFHNNLFAGGNGTAAFNDWAASVQSGGNVYLAGAGPSTGESGTVVNPDFNPGVKLTEGPDGEWWLEMAVDPVWLSIQTRSLVTTEMLDKAVIPDLSSRMPMVPLSR